MKKIINKSFFIFKLLFNFLNLVEAIVIDKEKVCFNKKVYRQMFSISILSLSNSFKFLLLLLYWDFVIDNNNTLQELYNKIDNIILNYQQ